MPIKLIVAMDRNKGIGRNNDLLWRLPADMKFFKDTTIGHSVLMGRKNFDSIPEKFRPLPGRKNIILTRNTQFSAPDCTVYHSLEEALKATPAEETLFVIGGGQIYQHALDLDCIDEMYITEVDALFEDADTFFPDFSFRKWNTELIHSSLKDEKNPYNFKIYHYTKG